MTNVSNSSRNGLIGEISRQAAQVGSSAFGLPRRIEDSLDRLDRGDIRVRVRSIETDRAIRRLSSVNLMMNYTLLVGTFTLSATVLLVSQLPWFALGMALPAAASGVALIRSLMRLGRADRMP